jgi:hypothetical protein
MDYGSLGSGMVIDGEALLALIEHQFFDGFDELWIFRESPIEGKPEAIPLTSDVRLVHELSEDLRNWMYDNGCIAGLGDGDGLNFATFKPALARLWGG